MSPSVISQVIEPILVNSNLSVDNTDSATAFALVAQSGAAAAVNWTPLTNHHKVCFILFLGTPNQLSTWTAGEDITTVEVQQASDSSGTGIKTVRTHTIAADVLDAQGDVSMFEVSSEELDVSGNFNHARLKVTGLNGTFVNVTVVALLYQPIYSKVSLDKIEYIATPKNAA